MLQFIDIHSASSILTYNELTVILCYFWLGSSALSSLCTTRGLQFWADLQVWSSGGNTQLQPFCIFSIRLTCCTVSYRILFAYLGSFCRLSWPTDLVHYLLQGEQDHPRIAPAVLILQQGFFYNPHPRFLQAVAKSVMIIVYLYILKVEVGKKPEENISKFKICI